MRLALAGLPALDLVVLGAYFIVLIAIGLWCSRRVRDREDYFLGGRRFGKVIQTFAAFGQATSTENSIGVSTTTYRNGASGIWGGLTLLWSTPIYWLTSPWYRRMRMLTLGDFFVERFRSPRLGATYAVVGTLHLTLLIGVGVHALGKTIAGMTPKDPAELSAAEAAEVADAMRLGQLEQRDPATLSAEEVQQRDHLREQSPRSTIPHVDPAMAMIVTCLIVLVYAFAGGLPAAFFSDVLQGICILILSVLLLPFCWAEVNRRFGGDGVSDAFSTLHARLPESHFQVFGSPMSVDFPWYFILAAVAITTINVAVAPNQMTAIGPAKDELTARFGFTFGTLIKRFVTVLWGLFALFALCLYSGELRDPDLAWGYASRDLLAPLGIGLVGLMIACLLAALMSTADCMMVTAAGLLSHNVYELARPDRSEAHYLRVGRVVGALVLGGGLATALAFEGLFDMIQFLWGFLAVMAAPFWLGIVWSRATRRAAWITVAVSLTLFLVLPTALPWLPSVREAEGLHQRTQDRLLQQEFRARAIDVETRAAELPPLQEGELFLRSVDIPGEALFWSQGVVEGRGQGLLHVDRLAMQSLGLPLEQWPIAAAEALAFALRILLPFGLMFGLSLLTRVGREERASSRAFFARMRTPVDPDPQKDAVALSAALADPDRGSEQKLFPGSAWEFRRWRRVDTLGFLAAWLAIAVVLAFFFAVLQFGR